MSHIRNLNIVAYRGINNLKFDNLGEINIIAGINNAGKTSVLEAFECFFESFGLYNWLSATRALSTGNKSIYHSLKEIFPADKDRMEICIKGTYDNEAESVVRANAFIEYVQISKKEFMRLNGYIKTGNTKEPDEIIDKNVLHWNSDVDGVVHSQDIYEGQNRIKVASASDISKTPRIGKIWDNTNISNDTTLRNVLMDKERYDELIAILRHFDSSITGLSAIDVSEGLIEYYVYSEAHSKAIALSSYGSGMKKMVEIFRAMVEAKDGLLIIDEFEVGIHYSVMRQVFDTLLNIAKKYNVQVVMTSHNLEAIEMMLTESCNNNANVAMYTLYRSDDKNAVRRMSGQEALRAKNILGLELR